MTRKRVTRVPTANLLNLLHLLRSASGPEANSPARGRAGPVIGVLRPSAEAILEMLGYGSRLPWAPRPARHHPSLDDSVEP
jgi:hypothetical protein